MAIASSVCLTVFVVFALLLPFPSAAVPSEELESAISVLRVRGRALFANAITTSDMLFDLLSAEYLTLLSPTDSMLFNLDMTISLPSYISTLRLHALPLRLPLSELRSLPNASSIPTFLPSRTLLLTKPSSSVFLDGVQLLLPGLFYAQHIALHGLANILPLTAPGSESELENRTVASPPVLDSPRSTCLAPSPEDYFTFLGPTPPAEPPMFGEVSVSPSQLEDLIVGDGDYGTTEF